MRGRAHCTAFPWRQQKHWEEGSTRDDLIKAIIDKELWNVAMATKAAREIVRALAGEEIYPDTWHEVLERNVIRRMGGSLVVSFEIEYDDGSTEPIDINMSADAVREAGLHLELQL